MALSILRNFDGLLQVREADNTERNAIMNVLIEFQFVELLEHTLQVTYHGNAYLSFLRETGQIA